MAKQPSALEVARKLVGINSINPTVGERACAEYVGNMLDEAGLEVSYHEFAEGRTGLIAHLRGTGNRPPICFTGHLDTVPLGAAPWKFDPFAGEIVDGKLYGRGVTDMKSGVAAFVVMALRMAARARGPAGVVLVITAGEETGCEGAFHMAKTKATGDAGALVVAEPSSNYPLIGHKGVVWIEVEATGVTAHGSMPELGDNAIYKAVRAITKLQKFGIEASSHDVFGRSTLTVSTISGGMNVNSVPDRTVFTADIRTVPNQDHDRLLARITALLGDEVCVKRLIDLAGVYTDSNDPWMQEVYDIAKPFLGEEPEPRALPGFTDAAALTPAYGNIPTVILGPGETKMAHQTDEYCYVDKIDQAVEIYEEIALRWCMRESEDI